MLDFFRRIALFGNLIFFLWILYNGIHEEFQGTRLEIISYIGLMMLLLLNAFLLHRGRNIERNNFKI
jgi:hypothetical protein